MTIVLIYYFKQKIMLQIYIYIFRTDRSAYPTEYLDFSQMASRIPFVNLWENVRIATRPRPYPPFCARSVPERQPKVLLLPLTSRLIVTRKSGHVLLRWLQCFEDVPRRNDIYGSLVLHVLFIPFLSFRSDPLVQIKRFSSLEPGRPRTTPTPSSLPAKATAVFCPQFSC